MCIADAYVHTYLKRLNVYTRRLRRELPGWARKTLQEDDSSVTNIWISFSVRFTGPSLKTKWTQYNNRQAVRPMRKWQHIQATVYQSSSTVTYAAIPAYRPIRDSCTSQLLLFGGLQYGSRSMTKTLKLNVLPKHSVWLFCLWWTPIWQTWEHFFQFGKLPSNYFLACSVQNSPTAGILVQHICIVHLRLHLGEEH